MRKLILQMQITVDGFASRANGYLNFAVWDFSDNWNWDKNLKNEFNNIFNSIDCILLSTNMVSTGDGYIDHWTKMGENHKDDPDFSFARKIAKAEKVIFGKSLKKAKWEKTSLVKTDLAEKVKNLKAQKGKNIIAFGGISFASALLKANLVDELQLFINPIIIGNGISVFKKLKDTQVHLVSSKSYKCGVAVTKYLINAPN